MGGQKSVAVALAVPERQLALMLRVHIYVGM